MNTFKRTVLILLTLELLIIALAILLYGYSLAALQTITAYSGRLSLLVYSFIFLFQHRHEKIAPWLSSKPYLVFAIGHGIHLIELLLFVNLSGAVLIPMRLAGGFLAYVIIFLMPVIVHYKESGRIPQARFIRIETFAQYYIWFIFFMSYFSRINGTLPNPFGSFAEHIAFFSWVILMLVIKVVGLVRFSVARNV